MEVVLVKYDKVVVIVAAATETNSSINSKSRSSNSICSSSCNSISGCRMLAVVVIVHNIKKVKVKTKLYSLCQNII